jgi:hypothetical protein
MLGIKKPAGSCRSSECFKPAERAGLCRWHYEHTHFLLNSCGSCKSFDGIHKDDCEHMRLYEEPKHFGRSVEENHRLGEEQWEARIRAVMENEKPHGA